MEKNRQESRTLECVLYRNREQAAPVEGHQDFLNYFERRASKSSVIMVQGPRTFLWPKGDKTSYYQHWAYPPLTAGWNVVNSIADRIVNSAPGVRFVHYGSIEDMENRPEGGEEVKIDIQMQRLKYSSPSLMSSPLFMNGHADHPAVRIFAESAFKPTVPLSSHADRMGVFQMKKIREQVIEYGNPEGVSLRDVGSLLLINLAPLGFERQQAIVLEALLRAMREDPIFIHVRKVARRQLIERIFRHLWIGEDGSVEGVTKPRWNVDKFVFDRI